MIYVTPYLPDIGNIAKRDWESGGKPAFISAYQQNLDGGCPNCQGVGMVCLIRTESGPYNAFVPHGKVKPRDGNGDTDIVVTWFDGNERWHKGWYQIHDTLTYICPECQKPPEQYQENYMPLVRLNELMQAHKPVIEELAKQMSSKKQLRVRQP